MAPRGGFPSRSRNNSNSCSCTMLVVIIFISSTALWIGIMGGYLLAKKPYGAHGRSPDPPPSVSVLRRALAAPVPVEVRSTPQQSTSTSDAMTVEATARPPLYTALESVSSGLSPLVGESVPILHYTLALTGHPPLVSRSDVTKDGQPDFANFGLPPALGPAPHFFVVDPFGGTQPPAAAAIIGDSPFRSVQAAEDTIRDVFMAVLQSPGHVRDTFGASPVCKASPVTTPYACLASLRSSPAGKNAFNADGTPRPAAEGGPLVLDIGHTAGGFYGILAATSGVSALTVDTQPQCTMWARLAARASGVADRVNSFAAIPIPPSSVGKSGSASAPATADARVRTGCIGTLTAIMHAAAGDVDAFYTKVMPAIAPEDDGRIKTEATRKFTGTEGPEALGGVGGGAFVKIPVSSVDDILCATYGGGLCEGSTADVTTPLILIAKIDARGREAAVLDGMKRLLSSPAHRPRNLLIEVNKKHIAAVLGLESAKAVSIKGAPAAAGDAFDDALVRGYSIFDEMTISDKDNIVLARYLMDTMTTLMTAGYEVLVSDRGWWCAQDPFRPSINLDPKASLLHDQPMTLEVWADKLSRRNEVDIWAYVSE